MTATFSCHVLDVVRGLPAAGLALSVHTSDGSVQPAVTDPEGRVQLTAPIPDGITTVTFETGAWFTARDQACFYPEVAVRFTCCTAGEHHHIALVLGPYGYSTYRGS